MKSQTPWYKEFWPWFIVALIMSVVIASIATISLAIKYDDAPAQGSYQKQGLGIVEKQPVSSPVKGSDASSSDKGAPVR